MYGIPETDVWRKGLSSVNQIAKKDSFLMQAVLFVEITLLPGKI